MPSHPGHPGCWWSLTPPFHPYPVPRTARGGLLSVALSRGSPRVGVTHHPARWSPDFPRRARQPPYPPRSPGRLVPRTAYRCCGAAGPRIRQVGPRRPKRAPHPHPLRTSCVICAPGTPHAELQQLVRSGNRGWGGGAGKSPSAHLRRRSSREGVLAPDSAVKRCLASFSISDPPDRARSHRSGADLWPVAREVEPRTPGHRSLVARRRETYAVRVRSRSFVARRRETCAVRVRSRSVVARRRETYAAYARSTIVGGPAAQTDSASR